MTTVEDEFQVTSRDKGHSATHTERGARIELQCVIVLWAHGAAW